MIIKFYRKYREIINLSKKEKFRQPPHIDMINFPYLNFANSIGRHVQSPIYRFIWEFNMGSIMDLIRNRLL